MRAGRKVRRWKDGAAGGEGRNFHTVHAAIAITTIAIAAAVIVVTRGCLGRGGAALSGAVDVHTTSEQFSRSNTRSQADWNRASGDFSRQCETTRYSTGGRFGTSSL